MLSLAGPDRSGLEEKHVTNSETEWSGIVMMRTKSIRDDTGTCTTEEELGVQSCRLVGFGCTCAYGGGGGGGGGDEEDARR